MLASRRQNACKVLGIALSFALLCLEASVALAQDQCTGGCSAADYPNGTPACTQQQLPRMCYIMQSPCCCPASYTTGCYNENGSLNTTSVSSTPTSTATPTNTGTRTSSRTATYTNTSTSIATSTVTPSATNTFIQTSTKTATASSTGTATAGETATNTTSSTVTSTAAATHSSTSSVVSSSTSVETNTDLTQANALSTAATVDQIGSADAAGAAVVECAQGANAILTDPATGGLLLQSCQSAFEAAKKMKEMEQKNSLNSGLDTAAALTANEAKFNSAEAEGIFSDLEQNYGVSKSDFIAKMLASGGDINGLSGLLGDKVPADKIAEAMEAANNLSAEERQKILDSLKGNSVAGNEYKRGAPIASKKAGAPGSLRDRLREAMSRSADSAGDGATEAASNSWARKPAAAKVETLTPTFGEDSNLLAPSEDAKELTIFDVVHRKYDEKSQFFRISHSSPRK